MSTLLDAKAPSRYARSPVIGPVVDSDRPWPGLFPFKEEQRYYFFGRDDEIDELLHCVRRDTVTLLFSKSGLGKSSLLQAGLFPQLRECGFLPVYIRLKFSEPSEPLMSQVKAALQEAIEKGDFAEVSLPTHDEPLWEYFHQRGGNIIDYSGREVRPVLVFDQFEEIFTLGGSSDTTRQLRDDFLDSFAQLVENSIPPDLRARLAENPKRADRYDFAAAACRFVVSLREDYLPKLERLRQLLPSLVFATSRMRLTEMDGAHALLAVSSPNPDLVTEGVADSIVRFVAGDTSEGQQPLDGLEVPPALLSLFCRELSIKRGAAPQITEELVSGNARTIIDDFYHRYIDDKPIPLRRMIEDKLVTKWGYRDNIDLKQAKEELEVAGVPASSLDELVDQRLLHVEEHRGTPRIELTHDVLVQPVTRSREKRLQEESLEKAREQQRKESRTRSLTILSITGMALLAFALWQWWRADHAWRAAHGAQISAEENARAANEETVRADKNAQQFQKEKERAERVLTPNLPRPGAPSLRSTAR